MRRNDLGAGESRTLEVDTTTPVVVLKLDANPFHHGGLGVIRSLGRLGVPVYAVHEEKFTPAASSRYLSGGWLWHPSLDDVDRLRQGFVRLAERIGRPAVLIPTDDAGALVLAEHGRDLREWFLFPAPPDGLPRQLADKYSLYQVCQRFGVPCVETIIATSVNEATGFAGRVGLPVVVKLTRPWRGGGSNGLRSTTVVRTYEELIGIFRQLEGADGAEVMLQEYIPGGQGHDWFFHGYLDATSNCRPAFTGLKKRSYPAHAGLTSLGRSTVNERLASEVQRFLADIDYRGIVDLDLRWDARDDQYKLLDFNPRIGAQFRLFRDSLGVDVAVAAHLDLTGRPVPHGRQIERGFLVENYDPMAALGYWRRGELTGSGWLKSLRGIDEFAWFASDDLRPFGLMCARLCWRMVERSFGIRIRRLASPEPRYRVGRAGAQPLTTKISDPDRSRPTSVRGERPHVRRR